MKQEDAFYTSIYCKSLKKIFTIGITTQVILREIQFVAFFHRDLQWRQRVVFALVLAWG
jgi:hypothetical protein